VRVGPIPLRADPSPGARREHALMLPGARNGLDARRYFRTPVRTGLSYTSRPTVRQVNVRRRARKTVDDASMSLQRRIWTRDEPEHLSAEGPPVPSPSATIRTLERLLRRRWFARGPNAL
jgi:hypothetical protein